MNAWMNPVYGLNDVVCTHKLKHPALVLLLLQRADLTGTC